MTTPITVAIAGSTQRTKVTAIALEKDPRFSLSWIVTPAPRRVGRKQLLEPNPLDQWAQEKNIPKVFVEEKIDHRVQDEIRVLNQLHPIELLVVVDFGYLVPDWLLSVPSRAPINIHPSSLPRWRGSSPGQFVILSGETKSAVTIMIMNSGLDTGPIVEQWPFAVQSGWTTPDYYSASFQLVDQKIADTLWRFCSGQIVPVLQPSDSPTLQAERISKDSSYIDWNVFMSAVSGSPFASAHQKTALNDRHSSSLLTSFADKDGWITTLERATRAFADWPGLWTLLPTPDGPRRLKIHTAHIQENKLVPQQVQIEGKKPVGWDQFKAAWIPK